MDAFTVLFSTVKYIFVLYLENPKKAGDPWDYALVRGKKSANWACNWKHWIHQLWWVRLVRGWKWSPETLRVPCEKKSPGRAQHLQKLKEASMMQLLKGSLLGQGQTFCQGEGIRDLLLWVWHQVVHNQSALHDQKRRHVEWQLRQNFKHWTFPFWITIIIDAIKCLFL